MSNGLQAPERKGLLISEQDIPFSAYQAIYHKITKKTEKLSREYKEPYEVQFSDIQNLDQRLNQLLAQYQVRGSRCEISHATKNGFSRTHSSFEKFRLSDSSARECTSSFSYQLDFLIVLPSQVPQAEDVAQRYKVDLVFEQDFIDEGDDEKLPYFLRGYFSLGSLRTSIEYADFAVAQAVDATIEGWVKQLPRKRPSKVHNFIKNCEAPVMNFSGALSATFTLTVGAFYLASSNPSTGRGAAAVLFFIGIGTLSAPIVQQILSRFYSIFRRTVPCPTLILTQGDKDRVAQVGTISNRANLIMSVLFVGCILAFAVSLSAAWVFDRLF